MAHSLAPLEAIVRGAYSLDQCPWNDQWRRERAQTRLGALFSHPARLSSPIKISIRLGPARQKIARSVQLGSPIKNLDPRAQQNSTQPQWNFPKTNARDWKGSNCLLHINQTICMQALTIVSRLTLILYMHVTAIDFSYVAIIWENVQPMTNFSRPCSPQYLLASKH